MDLSKYTTETLLAEIRRRGTDVAEVIRCKDCMYCKDLEDSPYCYLGDGCHKDMFCSRAKHRRADGKIIE